MKARQFNRAYGKGRRGYVLLIVIAVAVVVITVLSTLAKLSLRRGLEAADAERALQQRWGAITLERAMLDKAAEVFQARQERATRLNPGTPPPPSIRGALTLRGITFDLLLGDEDAKLNLNSLYNLAGLDRTRAVVNQMVGGGSIRAARLLPAAKPPRLRRGVTGFSAAGFSGAGRDGEDGAAPEDAFRSWGEVFDLQLLATRVGSDAALPNATTDITLWGTGQLNFQRASDEAILAVASSVIQDGGARRILERYRQSPAASLSVLLQTEVSNARNRESLKSLLSESSTNFSLWIDASSDTGGSLRYFSAMQRDEEGVTRTTKFMH